MIILAWKCVVLPIPSGNPRWEHSRMLVYIEENWRGQSHFRASLAQATACDMINRGIIWIARPLGASPFSGLRPVIRNGTAASLDKHFAGPGRSRIADIPAVTGLYTVLLPRACFAAVFSAHRATSWLAQTAPPPPCAQARFIGCRLSSFRCLCFAEEALILG